MRLEELKNEMPKTPDFIHSMIQEEVNKQMKETKIVSIRNKDKKWNMSRVAVASVACLIATSTIAYAGTKLYSMQIEKKGKYSVETGIKTENKEKTIKVPEKVYDISIAAGYMPSGMRWSDEGVKLEYENNPFQGGISIESVLMDKNDIHSVMRDTNVIESEEHRFGKYEGVYLKYNEVIKNNFFNQRIYMICPEQYRILILYIGDDVSKEEAYKFAENLVIKNKKEMLETAKMYKWSEYVDPEVETVDTIVTNGNVPVHQIGETIKLSFASGEDKNGKYVSTDGINVCVDDVKIADNLDLLDQEKIPEEWKNITDKDGKLVQNHLSYIKAGDGVETLDQIVDEKDVNQKLVYATVTYTNTTDEEINHLLYIGSLMTLLKQDDGTYSIYIPNETAGDGYDYYIGDGPADIGTMKYNSEVENYNDGGNYISSLKPGESIQVNMAWIVNEEDIENMYLNFSGNVYDFDEYLLDTGVVDIRN